MNRSCCARPSARALLWVALGILAVSGLVAAVPAGRRLVYRHVVPSLQRAGRGMQDLSSHPGKLAWLFGGSTLVTLSYSFCLVYCVAAFGGGLTAGLASVGVAAAQRLDLSRARRPDPGAPPDDSAH